MDLSQLKPSKGFVEVFGPRPFRPEPGETLINMRGRQVSYQQRIRDWDIVEPVELPAHAAKLFEDFSIGIGKAVAFTSSQRPGVHVIFPESQPWMDPYIFTGSAATIIIHAQAYYIEHVGSLPPDRIYPGNPGLWSMNAAKLAEEADALGEADALADEE